MSTTGFTLIELLVVIAIIALLLAILLPYPNKEQTLDYVINSWKDGVTEYIGYSPVSDFGRPVLKIFPADNEDGSWRPIIREEGGLSGRGEFDVWRPRHLITGSDGVRRVARARHRDGCNGAFMDGHSDWVQAEKMTERKRQPK